MKTNGTAGNIWMRGRKAVYVTAFLCMVILTGCSAGDRNEPDGAGKQVTKETAEIFAMNTIMSLTVYSEKPDELLAEARTMIRNYEALFSVSAGDSDVAKLNRAGGQPVKVSGETYELLKKSLAISERTGGIFDISIYPLVRAWGFTAGEYRVPSVKEREQILKTVDYRMIELHEDGTVSLPEQMQVDLGGIAKGYVSQRLMEVFRGRGAAAAVVSLGGNVQTYGKKPDGTPFTVGITNPADGTGLLGTIEVGETAVITSGAYQRYFERDGVRYHHIMDKRTGAPADSDLASVTVLSENGETADSLATALFVMGKERAVAFERENDDITCILIDKNGEIWTSEGIDFKRAQNK